jgi:hypothetical protein
MAPDALEDGVTVVERMGQDMDPGLFPRDELSIEPDALERFDGNHALTETCAFVKSRVEPL